MNKNKLTTIFVAAILLLSPLEFSFASDLSMHNETATMVAVRWAPVGMSWSGNNLVSAPDYNFDGNSIVSWGRTSFPMPDAEFAIDTNSYNIAATDTTNTIPLYYCVFYLNLDYDYQTPTRMKEKMFAVIDSAGQIWFDPDGNFNDCRYYGYSDPNDPNYRRDPVANVDWDDVRINKNCYVDPINGNNTQGPYYLFPTKQDGSSQPGLLDGYTSILQVGHRRPRGLLSDSTQSRSTNQDKVVPTRLGGHARFSAYSGQESKY